MGHELPKALSASDCESRELDDLLGQQPMNKLSGVPETMLIPLWCKAMETERPDGIIEDRKSLEIIAQIDYDSSRFQSAEVSRFSVITRTEIIDEIYLLDRHKDRLRPWLRLSSKIPRIRKIARISRYRIG